MVDTADLKFAAKQREGSTPSVPTTPHLIDFRREDVIAKVIERVRIPSDSDCWIWQGPCSGSGRGGGYGRMHLNGQTVSVHRVVYTHYYGYIPGKKQIDHICGNRKCCNPRHLEMVTHKQNQKRKNSTK